MMRVLLLSVFLPALALAGLTFREKLVAENIKLDTEWVDKEAHRQLDIVIALDTSGSVGPRNFELAKQWIREFLGFFSISAQYSQVGLVLFSTTAELTVPIRRDGNKCDFLMKLDRIKFRGGATNMEDGLLKTFQMLQFQSRVEIDRKLVVIISDGWYSMGKSPANLVDKIKRRYPRGHIMVIAIGRDYATHYGQMLNKFVSKDSKGKPMMFGLADFKQFAHVAYYFHGGDQKSQMYPSKSDMCSRRCNSDPKAACICDSLGRGKYECGCDRGTYVSAGPNSDTCIKCPVGLLSEYRTTRRSCYECTNSSTQTTLQTGSYSSAQCICKSGYSNIANPLSRTPPCGIMRCDVIDEDMKTNNQISAVGTCNNLFNSECKFQCAHGYRPIPQAQMSIKCDGNGRWSAAVPKCAPILCPVMTDSQNAEKWNCITKSEMSSSQSNQYGSMCKTQCKPGYYPRPGTSVFRICGADGVWSGTPVDCIPRTCPVLPVQPTGTYAYKQCDQPNLPRNHGLICEVTCKAGYALSKQMKSTFTCTINGNWSPVPYGLGAMCVDIEPPKIATCATNEHIWVNNDKGAATANMKITIPAATDNSGETPSVNVMIITGSRNFTNVDVSEQFPFPIGDNLVMFVFTDAAGNKGSCSYQVIAKDIEPPTVVQCTGPNTDAEGYIYTSNGTANVQWIEPEFADNSLVKPTIYRATGPGMFRLGTYNIKYTARDKAGNQAECSFQFTVTGMGCPPLHAPANGAISCDKMSFGTYCLPQCQAGLTFFLQDTMNYVPREYLCTLAGVWRPHNIVPDCTIRNTFGDMLVIEFEGNCSEESTIQQIKQNAFQAMQESHVGKEVINSGGLTEEDIHVKCGKTVDINDGTNERRKRSLHPVEEHYYRSKRGLTKEQLKAIQEFLKKKGIVVKKNPSCGQGQELKVERGKNYCYTCPPGMYWTRRTERCVNCPVGTYSTKDGTIASCTKCPAGTTTPDSGTGNATLCHETCSPGYYSYNGMMYPKSCSACAVGFYTDRYKQKACSSCPSGTSTPKTGSDKSSDCRTYCRAGSYSDSGLEPCNKCAKNTYQSATRQKSCRKCGRGQITQTAGSTNELQCLSVDECKVTPAPCRNGGRCIDDVGFFICSCASGWAGTQCEINVNECLSNPCWSGATCVDLVNSYKCVCPPGYAGPLCQKDINECGSKPCKNGGVCVDLVGDYECSCQPGYGAKDCSVNQEDCSPGICSNGGTCNDKVNGFHCNCASGFRGQLCSENINDCGLDSCKNGGTCIDKVNTVECTCPLGFTGRLCEVNINECRSNPCRNGATCTDRVNDYECTCNNNFGGKQCDQVKSANFDLAMVGNTVDDYVIYQPGAGLPSMSGLTISFYMKSSETGLHAHYGVMLSYGTASQPRGFMIQSFPEQMFMVNGENWLTGVEATNGQWNQVCMTWSSKTGEWKAYQAKPAGSGLRQVKKSLPEEAMSRGKAIPGNGKIILGQKYSGEGNEFPEQNIYQGWLNNMNIWFKYDQCVGGGPPDLTWVNLVRNGKMVTAHNKKMLRDGQTRG